MDGLPRETLLTLTCYLDGDAYLALSCVAHSYYKTLNEKSFLGEVIRLNQLPFLISDAAYYSYCYAQHFLTRHSLHNKENFYKVLKRTLQCGRMTPLAVEHLQRHVVVLMSSYLKFIDTRAAKELKSIYKRLTPGEAEVKKEIAAFFRSYSGEILNEKKGPKPEYLQRAKEGDLEWFRTGRIEDAFSCLFHAARYNQYEIALFILEKYREELKYGDFSLCHFLTLDLDARMASMLCTLNKGERASWRRAMMREVIANDNATVLHVLLSYYSARLPTGELRQDLVHYLQATILCDSVHCFQVLSELAVGEIIDSLDARCMLFANKCYRISKYYRMEKTFGDQIFSACFGGIYN